MSKLTPSQHYGEIVWLGTTADSEKDIASVSCDSIEANWEGFVGDCHSGLTRASCVRVRAQYEKGTEIRNTRQISILSEEELAEVATRLGVPLIKPEWVGANMILKGIPDFTLVPPNSRLLFDGGVTLTIDYENGPCKYPAEKIEEAHPGHGKDFPIKAQQKRGVTAWVEKPGSLSIGQRCRLHVPPQRLYPHI